MKRSFFMSDAWLDSYVAEHNGFYVLKCFIVECNGKKIQFTILTFSSNWNKMVTQKGLSWLAGFLEIILSGFPNSQYEVLALAVYLLESGKLL